MALMFKVTQSRLPNKEGQYPYNPQALYTGNVSTTQLAREVAAYSSLTAGDVMNTLENLVRVMTTHLQASEIVTLDGFGSFRLGFKSRGKGKLTAGEVTASQSAIRVLFRPASTRNNDGTVATRSLVSGVRCVLQPVSVVETDDPQAGQGGSQPGGGTESGGGETLG